MTIKKRQWVMVSLALVICVAVFLNWQFVKQQDGILNTGTGDSSDEKVLGDAQFVSGDAQTASEYLTKTRLTKQQAKEDALDLLQSVVASTDSTTSAKETANTEIVAIANNTELEGVIENLIKAKGFIDCVAFINDDNGNVVVPSEGLKQEEAAQIQEIVVSQTSVSPSKVKIVEIKN